MDLSVANEIARDIFQTFLNVLYGSVNCTYEKRGETLAIEQVEIDRDVSFVSLSLHESVPQFTLDQPKFDLIVVRNSNHAATEIYILKCTYWDKAGMPQWCSNDEVAGYFQAFMEYIACDYTNPKLPDVIPYSPFEEVEDDYPDCMFLPEDY